MLSFVGHVLRPAEIAAGIAWPAHPNFQFELAAACLGFAVGSLLAPWIRDRCYWLGVALVALLLAYEHLLVRPNDLRRLDAAFFTMNGVIAVAFFLAVAADVI